MILPIAALFSLNALPMFDLAPPMDSFSLAMPPNEVPTPENDELISNIRFFSPLAVGSMPDRLKSLEMLESAKSDNAVDLFVNKETPDTTKSSRAVAITVGTPMSPGRKALCCGTFLDITSTPAGVAVMSPQRAVRGKINKGKTQAEKNFVGAEPRLVLISFCPTFGEMTRSSANLNSIYSRLVLKQAVEPFIKYSDRHMTC